MTPTQRLNEIAGRVGRDMDCLCGLPQCERCIDATMFEARAKEDIIWLLEEVWVLREALRQIEQDPYIGFEKMKEIAYKALEERR
jgi:hypothetical protein